MTNLTDKWKAGELPQWRFYYVRYSGGVEPILLNGENDFNNHCRIINSLIKEVLAPVPTYEELQSLEADRPAKNEGEEIVAELKEENARLKERDEVFSVLIENLHGLQQEKWYDLVEHGTREQRLDFLRDTEKHTLFGAIDKNMQLRKLLKECKEFFEEENPKDFTIMSERMDELLTKIDEVLKCK